MADTNTIEAAEELEEGSIAVADDAPLPGELAGGGPAPVAPSSKAETPKIEDAPEAEETPAVRDAQGRFTSREKEQAKQDEKDQAEFDRLTGKTPTATEATTASAAPSSKGGKTADASTTEAQRIQIVQARRTLRRAQYEPEELDSMPTDRLLAKAEKLQPFFDRVDRGEAISPAGKPAKGNAAGTRQSASNAAATEGADALAASNADADDDTDALLDQLELDELPESAKKRLQRAEQDRAAAEARAEQAQTRANSMALANALDSIAEDFPQIKSQEGCDALLEYMHKVDPSMSALADPEDLMNLVRDSAWAAFGPQVKKQLQQARQQNRAVTLSRQPTRTTDNQQPRRKETQDDIDAREFARWTGATPQQPVGLHVPPAAGVPNVRFGKR